MAAPKHGSARGSTHGFAPHENGPRTQFESSRASSALRPLKRLVAFFDGLEPDRRRIALIVAAVLVVAAVCGVARALSGLGGDRTQPSESVDSSVFDTTDSETGSTVTGTYGAHQIEVTGAEGFSDSAAFSQLDEAVSTFEATGSSVGFVMVDLGSGASVSYNDERLFYPASSIKAPYVTSLYQRVFDVSGLSGSVENVCEQCIVESDNESFDRLHDLYGLNSFTAWLDDAGIEYNESEFGFYPYPNTSARQMQSMWVAIYDYLSSGTGNSASLKKMLSETMTSSLRDVLGSKYTVWAKAGWYPNEAGDSSTCEGGVVFSDTGTYVVAIMSNAPEDFDSMEWLVDAINIAHAGLTGGDTSSSITDETPLTNSEDERATLIADGTPSSPSDSEAGPQAQEAGPPDGSAPDEE